MGSVSRAPSFAIYEFPRTLYQGHFVLSFTLDWQNSEELRHSGTLKVQYVGGEGSLSVRQLPERCMRHGLQTSSETAVPPEESVALTIMKNIISSCIEGDEEMEELAAWDRLYEVGFVPTCQSLSLI